MQVLLSDNQVSIPSSSAILHHTTSLTRGSVDLLRCPRSSRTLVPFIGRTGFHIPSYLIITSSLYIFVIIQSIASPISTTLSTLIHIRLILDPRCQNPTKPSPRLYFRTIRHRLRTHHSKLPPSRPMLLRNLSPMPNCCRKSQRRAPSLISTSTCPSRLYCEKVQSGPMFKPRIVLEQKLW
jgi:hypothetical protein